MNDFPNLPFSQCINKISIKHKIKQKDYLDSGKYPVIDQAQSFISGYCNDEIAIKVKKPVIVFGDHTRCFKFVDFDFIAGADGIHILEPKDFFNAKLFYYFCLALDFANKGYSRHFQYLAKTTMKIPPLDIQKRIVSRLDEAFSRIDNGVSHLKSAKDNIIKYKQSLLKSAFNGTLTEDLTLESTHFTHPLAPFAREGEFWSGTPQNKGEQESVLKSPLPQHEGDLGEGVIASEQSERGNPQAKNIDCHDLTASNLAMTKKIPPPLRGANQKSPLPLRRGLGGGCIPAMTDKESPNLPQGWIIKTLGEVAQTTSGGTPSRKNLDYWRNGNIKWLKSGELNDDYIDEVEETITQSGLDNSSAKIFSKGTLLIALYGATIGKLGILNLETSTNQAVCAIMPNNELDTKYLFHFLFSIRNKMIKDAFGGAQSNISQTYLKQIKIPLPPLQTQKQIVKLLEKHLTSADKTSEFIESALNKAKQLKSSLLKSAFEGKLV